MSMETGKLIVKNSTLKSPWHNQRYLELKTQGILDRTVSCS
jgi:hypothetical protein